MSKIRPKELITNSRKSTYDLCRRKHSWAYEIGLRKQTDAKPLRMGSAFHEALDTLKQGLGIIVAINVIRDLYEVMPEGFDEYEWQIECETVVRLVCAYQWRWQESGIKIHVTEHPFHLPLINPVTGKPSINFDFAGVIDGVVEMEDSRQAVMEHKLLGEDHGPDSDLRRRLRIDHQISFYVIAARMLGYEIATVLYDVTRKPTIKPTPIPLTDDDGFKIVLDAEDERVFNKAIDKPCTDTDGLRIVVDQDGDRVFGKNGRPRQTASKEMGQAMKMRPATIEEMTPRQTGDTEKGWVLQTRPMTIEEWGEKLTADIVERPDWYFSRIEIPRLDDEIEEARHELWAVQKTLRESQRTERWFRTVNRNTCPFCAYFELCTSKFDPTTGLVPEGFAYVENKHPELGDFNADNSPLASTESTTATASGEEARKATGSATPPAVAG